MVRKTIILLLAVMLIASFVLSACGPTSSAEDDLVILRFGSWAGVDEAAEIQAILDELNPQLAEKGYMLIHEPQPADYYIKLQTSMAGRVAADLFWVSQEHVANYASKDILLDMSDCLATSDHPAADLTDYFPDILKTVQYQGSTYGLPWIAQPTVLYYNKGLFDEAGLEYPNESWTWGIFQENAVALTKDLDGDGRNDQWGFTLDGWPPPQMFAWQGGGEVIAEDLQSSPVDTPEAIAGWEFYGNMIYDDIHAVPEAILVERGAGDMFKNGQIAMFMGGAADDLDRVEGLDVGVEPVPAGPAGRINFAWTASTVVPSFTEHPEFACEALILLSDAFHHWKIVPPRGSLATAEMISELEPRKAHTAADIVRAVPDMRAFNVIPRHSEWDNAFWKEFMDPLFRKQDTAENLAKAIRPRLEGFLPQE